MATELENEMRTEINRGLLKYACGRFLYCSHCGNILDCRTSVLVRNDTRPVCIACFHNAGFGERNPAEMYGPHLFSSLSMEDAERYTREWLFAHPGWMDFADAVYTATMDGCAWFSWREWSKKGGARERMLSRYGERLMVLSMHDDADKLPGPTVRNPIHADEVTIGKVYRMKVSGRIVDVRIERETHRALLHGRERSLRRCWIGVNLSTGKEVKILSASKLRGEVKGR